MDNNLDNLIVRCATVRIVGRGLRMAPAAKLEAPNALLLGRKVFVLLLLPVLREVPVVLVCLVFVLEPLGVVREL